MGVFPDIKELPRNAIGLIALLLYLPIALATIAIGMVVAAHQVLLMWFIVVYSTLVMLLFFVTLWFKDAALASFPDRIRLIEIVHRVSLRQEVAALRPDSNVLQIKRMVYRLVEAGETLEAIEFSRKQFGRGRSSYTRKLWTVTT